MQDEDHALDESIDDLPHASTALKPRVPNDAKFVSLLLKVLSDQWVIFSLIVMLVPVGLLILDLGFGIDVMAEESKAAGRGGRNEDSTWFLIPMSAICILGASIMFFVRYQRIQGVHVNGVDVPCKIIDRGKHVYKGLTDVTIQYEYGGRTYRPRVSITIGQIEHLNQIRINQKKPGQYWLDW